MAPPMPAPSALPPSLRPLAGVRWLVAAVLLLGATACAPDGDGEPAAAEPDAGETPADPDAGSTPGDSDIGETPVEPGGCPVEPGGCYEAMGDGAAAVAAPTVWVSDPNRTPRNVHATWQRDPSTTLTFSWAVNELDLEAYVPMVWIVPSSEATAGGDGAVVMPLDPAASLHSGYGETYTESLLGVPAGDGVFPAYHVEVTGLCPDTTYTYRVGTMGGFDAGTGTFDDPQWSEAFSIKTALPKGSRAPFQVMLAGDSRGGMDKIRQHADMLAAYDADAWFFNGDMTNTGFQLEWEDWWDSMQPITTARVLMPVQGNHEIFADVYYAQNELPREEGLPPGYEEHGWSVTLGNVHFVGLDSNTRDTVEAMLEWLEADLAAASQDPDIDFIVTMSHHSAYSASNHGSTPRLQEHWVPLFEQYGVDLVFAGHDHNYERSHPVRDGQVVADGEGPVYVVAGGFYAPGYSNGNEWWTATSYHGDIGNHATLLVDGKRLELKAYSGDGAQQLDSYVLDKN